MKHYGLSLSKPGAIPDHISVLLEFMEKVILAKIRAAEEHPSKPEAVWEADDIQKRFFSTYISSWFEKFLVKADRAQPHVFYEEVVAFTRDFMGQEKSVLLPKS